MTLQDFPSIDGSEWARMRSNRRTLTLSGGERTQPPPYLMVACKARQTITATAIDPANTHFTEYTICDPV